MELLKELQLSKMGVLFVQQDISAYKELITLS